MQTLIRTCACHVVASTVTKTFHPILQENYAVPIWVIRCHTPAPISFNDLYLSFTSTWILHSTLIFAVLDILRNLARSSFIKNFNYHIKIQSYISRLFLTECKFIFSCLEIKMLLGQKLLHNKFHHHLSPYLNIIERIATPMLSFLRFSQGITACHISSCQVW